MDGLVFVFEPYEQIGGAWLGVYAATEPKEIAALNKAVGNKGSVISVITEAEYNKLKKKAAQREPDLISWSPEPQALPVLAAAAGSNVVAVNEVRTAVVTPAQPPPPPPPPSARRRA